MCSRFRIELTLLASMALAACHPSQGAHGGGSPAEQSTSSVVVTSALAPGLARPLKTIDPRAEQYYDNAQAVMTGKRLYGQFNCVGCHSNGGGGMGPSLMDDAWIYGGRLEQIRQTLVEGRPNGMPTWGGKIPDEQLWELAAYVRSMSLPETLSAQHDATPSQSPAPVPRAADADDGWAPPPDTTNDYTSVIQGPSG